ncbi:LAFE_0E07492g1_1 [Lachancea fermentati]|uniref:LAFE_0E07492g1_1 n=1 Tax=Lachancea fermentati TaxID=4955 RepID=A0A1G4MDL5_LACFM|nr:LAFE_0E07492g1_1 [Lachancea fermentati]
MATTTSCFIELYQENELSQSRIQWLLETIYEKAPTEGVTPSHLTDIITFLCESSLLATTTKVYLIEHCLIPNDYIPSAVIYTIIEHLGASSLQTMYKLQTPEAIQIHLCKWVVHIFFLLEDTSVFEKTYSLWFHLWSFDYLQHWITYVLYWSTLKMHVRPWRVKKLALLGFKTGYRNSAALSTLILMRYQSIESQDLIADFITRLNCNARKLNTLKKGMFDKDFHHLCAGVLESNNVLSKECFDEAVRDLIRQLNSTKSHVFEVYDKTNVSIQWSQVTTMQKLVRSIEHINIPQVDVDTLFLEDNKISRVALTMLDFEEDIWRTIEKWCQIKYKLLSKKNEEERRQLALSISFVCLINTEVFLSIEGSLIKKSFPRDLENPLIFLSLSFVSLLIEPKSPEILKQTLITKLVSTRLLDSDAYVPSFTLISGNILMLLRMWIEISISHDIMHVCLSISNIILIMLMEDAKNFPFNRHITLTISLLLKTLKQYPIHKIRQDDLELLIIPKTIVYALMTLNDPVIISSLSEYLISSKEFLKNLEVASPYVKLLNQYVIDITNYLWRNKISNSESLFSIPVDFIKRYVATVYTEDYISNLKSCFTISGLPSFSFILFMLLRKMKNIDCKMHINDIVFEKGYRNLKKHNSDCSLLITFPTYDTIRLAVLESMKKTVAYRGVADFLTTYLKSLSDTKDQKKLT